MDELGIFIQQANYSLVEAEDSCSVQKQAAAILELCTSHYHTRKPQCQISQNPRSASDSNVLQVYNPFPAPC